MLKGVQVSSGGVRGVWSRHGLMTKIDRLLRMEEMSRKRRLKLTEKQIPRPDDTLERFDPGFRERHIEVHFPGDLVAVDTFFVGTLKGVGRVYLQAVLDGYSRLFLQLEEIEHRTTKVRRPQSNGFIGRFHRTLLDEHFRVQGRSKGYETVDEMQQDLDAYLETYNRKHPHPGRGMYGRVPCAVFEAGCLREAEKAARSPPRKEDEKKAE